MGATPSLGYCALQDIDDGWGLDEEEAGPFLRAVPQTQSRPRSHSDLDAGWALIPEAVDKLTSPTRPVLAALPLDGPTRGNEAVHRDFSPKTEDNAPVEAEAQASVLIARCFSEMEDAFFAVGEDISAEAESAPQEPVATSQSWWRRFRRGKA